MPGSTVPCADVRCELHFSVRAPRILLLWGNAALGLFGREGCLFFMQVLRGPSKSLSVQARLILNPARRISSTAKLQIHPWLRLPEPSVACVPEREALECVAQLASLPLW